jgi:predicted RNA-binding protein with PIN domain
VLLIDAYNVLHAAANLGPDYAGLGLNRLITMLNRSRWASEKVALVCDGTAKTDLPEPPRQIRVIYAGPGRDADSLIERMIDQSTGARDLIVVSNDNRIRKYARRSKARVLGSERFLKIAAQQVTPRQTPGKPTVQDPDRWMDLFDLDDSEIADLEQQLKPEVDVERVRDKPASPESPQPKRKRQAESETDYWLQEFGFDE